MGKTAGSHGDAKAYQPRASGWAVRALRRGGSSCGPMPNVSQQALTRSARDKLSAVSRRGKNSPFSMRRTVGAEISAVTARARALNAARSRASRSRWPMEAHDGSSSGACACSIPKANQQTETPSVRESRSIVSMPGTRAPASRFAMALLAKPASSDNAVFGSFESSRALFSREGKPTWAGFRLP